MAEIPDTSASRRLRFNNTDIELEAKRRLKRSTEKRMKPELLFKVTPSGDPLLRSSNSSCPDVTFAFVGGTEENRRLMRLAFDIHFGEVHKGEDASKSETVRIS